MGNNMLIAGKTRLDILSAALGVGKNGAHIAPSLSAVEIYLSVLMNKTSEDSFILSKGHGALGYYASMHQMKIITDEQFNTFEQNGGEFPGQPSRSASNHIEYSSGSLGMGMPYALGVAIAKKQSKQKVFVVVGDGELNEGSNWEAAALSTKYELDNLVVVVDNNRLQSDGKCIDIVGQNISEIWKSFGWHVVSCDGHSIEEISKCIKCNHDGKPLVIIANTVKGKGVSFMENNNAWHHSVLKNDDYDKAVKEVCENYGIL